MNEYYDNNTFGTPLLFISTIQPIRLMPEKVSSIAEKQIVNKICLKCKTLWKNVKSDKEICTLNRCGGRLDIYKEDVAIDNKNVSLNQAKAQLPEKSSLN